MWLCVASSSGLLDEFKVQTMVALKMMTKCLLVDAGYLEREIPACRSLGHRREDREIMVAKV